MNIPRQSFLNLFIAFLLAPLAVCAASPSLPREPALSSGADVSFHEDPRIAQLFSDAGVDGTLVVFVATAGALTGHNEARARQCLVPASTFKIPHTLIGLTAGAVTSVDEVLPYGGAPQPFEEWERDMSLREAIALSAVPIYQALARRIGPERMREQLAQLDYGNGEIGTAVDRFWLSGPLCISAVDQARFLAQLAAATLPAPAAAQRETQAIVRLEESGGAILYGKTGWENAPEPGTGWWVGWVTTAEGRIHTFALNIDVRTAADADKRLPLGRAALQLLGVWPAQQTNASVAARSDDDNPSVDAQDNE